jgi:hypothetical protein
MNYYYLITLSDGTFRKLSNKQFMDVFPVAADDVVPRLVQVQYFYPSAIDWEMLQDD